MKMTRNLLDRTVPTMLIGALVVDLVLIGAVLMAKGELRSARAEYGRAGRESPGTPTAGFGLGGTPVELAGQKAGFAVWYASSRCPYCQKDDEWRRLAVALQQRGLRVLVLLPSVADSFAADEPLLGDAQQVAYMNAEWLRRYPLSVTPTLLIFDREQRLIWHKYGMLKPADTRAALSAVDLAVRGE
jgi:hypothetical protein